MATTATKGRGNKSAVSLVEVPRSNKVGREGNPAVAQMGAVKKSAATGMSVSPESTTIAPGQTQQFVVNTFSTKNNADEITWATGNSNVATIDETGLATAIKGGTTTIIAKSAAGSARANLTVSTGALDAIEVSPSTLSLAVGERKQLTATGNYDDGSTQDLTTTVQWTSSDPTKASVSSSGMALGRATGSTSISASLGDTSSDNNSQITITPAAVKSISVSPSQASVGAGQTLQFTAVATYTDGTTQDVTADAAWTLNPAGSATINTNGLVTGLGVGSATVTATFTDDDGAGFEAEAELDTLLNFTDLGQADIQAFANAKSRVNLLLTAFERRGNLSDDEVAQLKDALELVTEFINNNPSTPIPNFNASGVGGQSDLAKLGIPFNADPSKGPIGTGSRKANVIDDRFRAICDYLYARKPPIVGLEHDPGTFPDGNGPNPGGLTDEQLRVAAIYGYVENSLAVAPPYKTDDSLYTTADATRRALFNQVVEAADAHFRTNRPLYVATLARLIQISQPPQISVSDFAKVVDLLVKQGISAGNPQINTWIDRALDTAQNVGQAPVPSEINIDLPDLEQDVSNFEIISGNIFALQPAYFCAMLEELKVFQVVEKLVELFQNGILPVVRGDAGNLLFAYWKNAALRVSEGERRKFYAQALGLPGGDTDSPNREFKDLFMRFVSAVSSFVRQNTIDNIVRSNIPGAISQQQIRKSARDLATNISSHGYGIAYPMATELQKEINDVMAILKADEIQNAYGAKDLWQLVDQVAGLELGGAKNSVKYRTMASAGATVFAWLANRSRQLASSSYAPILDIAQLFNAPSYSTKPTTNPSDFDLVGACDQWLAVTGTQEDSVEQAAQPIEAPVMPSRPIQIPSIARDMLESVGVPAMAYAAIPGKTNGTSYNWRYK